MKIYMVVDYPEVRGFFKKEDAEKQVTENGGYIRELPVMGELPVYVVAHHCPTGVYSDPEDAKHIASMAHLNWYKLPVKE